MAWQEHRKTIGTTPETSIKAQHKTSHEKASRHNTRQHMEKKHLHKHTLAHHISHEHTTGQKYNLFLQPATIKHNSLKMGFIPYIWLRPGPIAAVLSKYSGVIASNSIPHVNNVNYNVQILIHSIFQSLQFILTRISLGI